MSTNDIIIVLNLVLLESLLSVDNAAVLAIMVKDLPGKQKNRALKYGLLGAYLFRGLSLFFVSFLMKMWFLKVLGGIYLCWMAIGHFTKANDTMEEAAPEKESRIFRMVSKAGIGRFWSTVILVEVMDMAFSVDNVFAAVAMTDKIWLILIGVFIGILAMRFVAQAFTRLMEKYPDLERSAFYVIGLLGLKLILGEVLPEAISAAMKSHTFDLYFSISMIAIFLVPLMLGRKQKAETISEYTEDNEATPLFDIDSDQNPELPLIINSDFHSGKISYGALFKICKTDYYQYFFIDYGFLPSKGLTEQDLSDPNLNFKCLSIYLLQGHLNKYLGDRLIIENYSTPPEDRPHITKVKVWFNANDEAMSNSRTEFHLNPDDLRKFFRKQIEKCKEALMRDQYYKDIEERRLIIHSEDNWENVRERVMAEYDNKDGSDPASE